MKEFWGSLVPLCQTRPRRIKKARDYPVLPVASDAEQPLGKSPLRPKGSELEREEQANQVKMDFNRVRCFIRTCCQRLVRHFKDFIEEVDEEQVCTNSITLMDVREWNNEREFPTVDAFLADIDQIVQNVRDTYNPRVLAAREYMNEACHLQDQALALACQADRDLVMRVRGHISRAKAQGRYKSPQRRLNKHQSSAKEDEEEKAPMDEVENENTERHNSSSLPSPPAQASETP